MTHHHLTHDPCCKVQTGFFENKALIGGSLSIAKRLTLVLALLIPVGHCLALPPTQAAEELIRRLKNIRTMQADFVQSAGSTLQPNNQTPSTVINPAIEQSAGSMALSSPLHFRWELLSPYKQLNLLNGTKLTIYDYDLEQVVYKKFNPQHPDSPATLLTHPETLATNRFKVKRQSAPHKGRVSFLVTANNQDEIYQKIIFYFQHQTLTELFLRSSLGDEIKICFSNIRLNKKLSNKLFNVKIPPNVDIIDERQSRS